MIFFQLFGPLPSDTLASMERNASALRSKRRVCKLHLFAHHDNLQAQWFATLGLHTTLQRL
jgi:hypothetical protein